MAVAVRPAYNNIPAPPGRGQASGEESALRGRRAGRRRATKGCVWGGGGEKVLEITLTYIPSEVVPGEPFPVKNRQFFPVVSLVRARRRPVTLTATAASRTYYFIRIPTHNTA